jgi:hypothetical protein
MLTGLTGDAADSGNPRLMSLIVKDALGATKAIQRAAFIIDSPNSRIQPQRNGVDVDGGDGPTKLNVVEGYGIGVGAATDAGATTYTLRAKLWQPSIMIDMPASEFPATTNVYFSKADWLSIPEDRTITAWDITCDVPGTADISMWRCARDDYPDGFELLFTASIVDDVAASATDLSSQIFAGDWLRCSFNINGTPMSGFNRLQMRMRAD